MEENNTKTLKVVEEQPVTFLKSSPHELQRVMRSLTTASVAASDFLQAVMKNEEVEPRIRVDAAKAIISLGIAASKELNADSLQRLVAQYRMQNPQQTKLLVDDNNKQERPKPIVDFSCIKNID